jgi:hypothetical protein
MANAFYKVPFPINEPVKEYKPGSPEKAELKKMISKLRNEIWEVPMVIGGEEIRTDNTSDIFPPHELDKKIGVGQPRKVINAKVLIANTSMDTDKIKIYGSNYSG